MKKNFTEIVFILDRSGSMGGLESDTIGGYNSMLKKQKKEKGEAVISTVLFDDRTEVLHNRKKIKNVKPITDREYYVRGLVMTKKELQEKIEGKIKRHYGITPQEAKASVLYDACALVVRDMLMDKWAETQNEIKKKQAKQLCYFSIEFLLGRSLRNNVYNLGLMDQFESILKGYGISHFRILQRVHILHGLTIKIS